MLRFVILGIVILAIMFEKRMDINEIGGSKNFHMSHGNSKNMYKLMRDEGVSAEDLKKFVQLEDRLLQVERNSICSGMSNTIKATALSDLIKDMFPKYNFSYHTFHIKQAAEPSKNLNKLITC